MKSQSAIESWQARAGEVKGFTGGPSFYEAPKKSEPRFDAGTDFLEACLETDINQPV